MSRTFGLASISAPASARRLTRTERIARLDRLAHLMDTAFGVPGTRIRFGFDSLVGLIPGAGDVLTTAVSLYIVREAYLLGAPRRLIARMLSNVAMDGFVGAVPVLGDAYDLFWKANRRNLRLLREWVNRQELR